MRVQTLLVLGVVLLGGCGGGSSPAGSDAPATSVTTTEGTSVTTTEQTGSDFERAEVESCLKASPVVTETMRFDEGGQLATPAGEGEFRATFKGNELNIAFERSESDAEAREKNLHEFNEIWDEGFQPELVIRRGNAVWEWTNTPTPDEEQTLDRCLGG